MQIVSKLHSLKYKTGLVRQIPKPRLLGSSNMVRIPDAYESRVLDAINGDQSLVVGREEMEESWRWCDSLTQAWERQGMRVKSYPTGSMGPTRVDLLIEKGGHSWHE